MDAENTDDAAAMPPASAGSRGGQCRCGLATRLVGDGCEHCNPAMMIDILREQVAEMRLTDEEREAIAGAMWDYGQYADEMGLSVAEVTERQATLRGLLERTNGEHGRSGASHE